MPVLALLSLVAVLWIKAALDRALLRLAVEQPTAMAAVQARLADSQVGVLRLLHPPLQQAQPSAGYIQAYPPGVRENGGQYTHAGAWALMAAALVAQREPGNAHARNTPYRLFTYLSPAHRAAHPQWGRAYGLEPYAVAADVYSAPPYTGRGGWSWYTGAAGWLHRGAVESILGLNLQAIDTADPQRPEVQSPLGTVYLGDVPWAVLLACGLVAHCASSMRAPTVPVEP